AAFSGSCRSHCIDFLHIHGVPALSRRLGALASSSGRQNRPHHQIANQLVSRIDRVRLVQLERLLAEHCVRQLHEKPSHTAKAIQVPWSGERGLSSISLPSTSAEIRLAMNAMA